MRVSTLFLLLLLSAAAVANCGSDGETNEDLLNSLPTFPGAQQLEKSTYNEGDVLEVFFQTPSGTLNSDIIDFFVAELQGEWCYATSSAYHYESESYQGPNGERVYLIDADGLNAVFQGRGSTILLATHEASPGGDVYELDIGRTDERDPDINECDR